MNVYDVANGSFEVLGSVATWFNVRRLLRDRVVHGVDYRSMAFFAAWGLWNLVYYPHLDQWFSFAGGVLLVTGNLAWLSLGLYYKMRAI